MKKSPDAFRTISEVSEWLETPAHVLRFWESRFSQVKPVKRAGGRRYYRPSDMLLLGGIKRLLHEDGMTIRGAQKILREQGVKHVATLSQPLDSEADLELTATEVTPNANPAVVEAPMAVDVPPEPVADNATSGDNVVPLTLDTVQPALPLDDANDAVKTPAGDFGVAPDADPASGPAPEEPPQEAAEAPEPAEEPTAADLPPVADDPGLPPLRLDPASAAPESDVPPPAPVPDDDAAELRPLGANLPKHDPGDDDDSFVRHMPPPLTIQLRDRVVRLKLSQEHHDEINSAVSRLNALQDRMSNGG